MNHSFSIFRAHNDGTYGSDPHRTILRTIIPYGVPLLCHAYVSNGLCNRNVYSLSWAVEQRLVQPRQITWHCFKYNTTCSCRPLQSSHHKRGQKCSPNVAKILRKLCLPLFHRFSIFFCAIFYTVRKVKRQSASASSIEATTLKKRHL